MQRDKLKRFRWNLVRRGFTLPEVLVTIALVAILAAVVVPTVANQLKKGDPNRVGSDFSSIQGAVEQFLSDVRKYPNSIGQLTNTIATTGANMNPLTSTNVYGSADVTRWKGPYLTKDSVSAIQTGFGNSFVYTFSECNFSTSSNTCGGVATTNINYLTLVMAGVDSVTWVAIDNAIDDGNKSSGIVRWACTASCSTGTASLYLLAMPVQP
jgi:prepilin-type N-terminal cleavage/methylation domain-containing protein